MWWIYSRTRRPMYGLRLLNYTALISPCNSLGSKAGCSREDQFVLLVLGLDYGQKMQFGAPDHSGKDPAAVPAPSLLMGPLALVLIPVPCKHGSVVKQDDFQWGLARRTCQEPKYHPECLERGNIVLCTWKIS